MPTPCQPLLNPVPNGGAGSPFPSPLTSDDIPIFDQPTFGPDIRQLLGTAGDSSDGWDAAVAALETTISEWDTEQAAQDAQLDTILTDLANKTATSSLDTSLGDYTNSFDAGSAIVNTAQGILIPAAGVIPEWIDNPKASLVTPPSGGGAQVPGQVTEGDPAFVWKVVFAAPGPADFPPSNPRLLSKSDIFTAVSMISAVRGDVSQIPGSTGHGQTWIVTLNVHINPLHAGVFADSVLLTAYVPIFSNTFLHALEIEIKPKPA